MVIYQKIAPPTHLKPYVVCFYLWEVDLVSTGPLFVESPPTGYASMVFNYGTPYDVASARNTFSKTPQAFITGQASKNYRFCIQKSLGAVGIVFHPSAIASLFGVKMYEFTDERHDLLSVLGKEAGYLVEQIEEAPTPAEKIEVLIGFLNGVLLKRNHRPDKTDLAAQLIIGKKGVVQISDLLMDLYVSRRQFERSFMMKVGVSPKYFARVRRISHLCNLMVQKKWQIEDWHELVHGLGYYDQAHFIKDFASFTGKAPSEYLKHNLELANWLKA